MVAFTYLITGYVYIFISFTLDISFFTDALVPSATLAENSSRKVAPPLHQPRRRARRVRREEYVCMYRAAFLCGYNNKSEQFSLIKLVKLTALSYKYASWKV
jgi:hypothetical protein